MTCNKPLVCLFVCLFVYRSSNYRIDYVIVIKNFLNTKGHQNPISGSNVRDILMKGWILLFGGASSGRVCACSLCSRLVSKSNMLNQMAKKLNSYLGTYTKRKVCLYFYSKLRFFVLNTFLDATLLSVESLYIGN